MYDDRQFVFLLLLPANNTKQGQADGGPLHDMARACGSGDGWDVDIASVEQRADRGNAWLASRRDRCQRDGLHVQPAIDQLLSGERVVRHLKRATQESSRSLDAVV